MHIIKWLIDQSANESNIQIRQVYNFPITKSWDFNTENS
jgi:hypothetical protein